MKMVKLFVDNLKVINLLNIRLEQHNIPYEIHEVNTKIGIKPPYLIVEGVPLDFIRALKWIEGYEHE